MLLGRGRTATSLHIDKVVDELGYVEGNLGVLTNRDNVLKEHARRKKVMWVDPDEQHPRGSIKTIDQTPSEESAGIEEVPF